jgi:hypothetical protein
MPCTDVDRWARPRSAAGVHRVAEDVGGGLVAVERAAAAAHATDGDVFDDVAAADDPRHGDLSVVDALTKERCR